jgi:hypothetical protein
MGMIVCLAQLFAAMVVGSKAFEMSQSQPSFSKVSQATSCPSRPAAAATNLRASGSTQSSPALPDLCGVYTWTYSGGSFPIEFRSDGNFFCKSYPALAKWELRENTLQIDWKKYGKYELQVNSL